MNSAGTIDNIFAVLDETKQEIRIVNLRPAPGEEDPIVCSLDHVSLISTYHPPYEGLSWCWGDPNDTEQIQLQGEIWHAPRNLVTALRAIRHTYEFRTLWVDAFCINQCTISSAALKERSSQVQLMNKIYASAESVIVWLGPNKPWTEKFCSSLIRLSRLITCPEEARHEILKHGHVDLSHHLVFTKWLWELILRPWWRRAWILQEIVLARKATVVIGSSSLPLQDLLGAFVTIQNSWRHLRNLSRADADRFMSWNAYVVMLENLHVYGVSNLLQPFINHLSVDQPVKDSNIFSTLAQVLVACRFQLATDPRDMIYGFLGMMPEIISQYIRPEYEVPYEQIYTRTAFTIIQRTQSLFVMSQAQIAILQAATQTSTSNLPSWVPDWSLRRRFVGYSMENRAGFRLDREALFNTSYNTPANVDLVDGHILRVKGIKLDNVVSMERLWKKDITGLKYILNLSLLHNWIATHFHRSTMPYRTQSDMHSAFWRAFLHDMQPTDAYLPLSTSTLSSIIRLESKSQPSKRCTDDVIMKCEAWRIAYEACTSRCQQNETSITPDNDSAVPLFPFLSQTHDRTLTGIRLFTTRSEYIGLCTSAVQPSSVIREAEKSQGDTPKEAVNVSHPYSNGNDEDDNEGDIVVVLAGGTHPYILRPTHSPERQGSTKDSKKQGKKYRVICECFVSGILDGEIVRDLEAGKSGNDSGDGDDSDGSLEWEDINIE